MIVYEMTFSRELPKVPPVVLLSSVKISNPSEKGISLLTGHKDAAGEIWTPILRDVYRNIPTIFKMAFEKRRSIWFPNDGNPEIPAYCELTDAKGNPLLRINFKVYSDTEAVAEKVNKKKLDFLHSPDLFSGTHAEGMTLKELENKIDLLKRTEIRSQRQDRLLARLQRVYNTFTDTLKYA